MGRYSRELAPLFVDFALPSRGGRLLDVGCGPGNLTELAAQRLGADQVAAIDPAPQFVAACQDRCPGVDVRLASAEQLPFLDGEFHAAAAQLVLHFVPDAERGAAEMARVVRPGGMVAATVWDFAEGMQMLRAFWDAALRVDPDAPDEARTLRFGGPGDLVGLLRGAGLEEIEETTLVVGSRYSGFDELWSTFLGGVGPAGAYTVARTRADRELLRQAFFDELGCPTAGFTLRAVARAARGRRPGGSA